MQKQPRAKLNSPAKMVNLMAASEDIASVPVNIFLTDEELVTWNQAAVTRPSDEWTEIELVQLAKFCQIDSRLNAHWRAYDREGVSLMDDKGRCYKNPLVDGITMLAREHKFLMRKLSLIQERDHIDVNQSKKGRLLNTIANQSEFY